MKNIEFFNAIEIVQQIKEQETKEQVEKLAEFLDSHCDLFSSQDWYYYAEVTGKSIQWLREHAKYHSSEGEYGTMLESAIMDGDFELAEFYV